MIGFLRGLVAGRTEEYVLLDVGGVGYRVFMPVRSLVRTTQDQELRVHTSMQVREDSMTMYGFSSIAEKELFEKLLTVSKVGPKMALSVLSAFEPAELSEAVYLGDVASLSRVSGVGKKTAERIVMELKDKIGGPAVSAGTSAASGGLPGGAAGGKGAGAAAPSDALTEAREAMTALGYTSPEIQQALKGCRDELPEDAGVEELLRFALARIARGVSG